MTLYTIIDQHGQEWATYTSAMAADRAKIDLTRATGRIFTIKIERIGS